jgi:hypothetical protein
MLIGVSAPEGRLPSEIVPAITVWAHFAKPIEN